MTDSDVLKLLGLVAFVVAGFLSSLVAGFVVIGVVCVLAGVAREAKVRRRGTSRPSP